MSDLTEYETRILDEFRWRHCRAGEKLLLSVLHSMPDAPARDVAIGGLVDKGVLTRDGNQLFLTEDGFDLIR